jgi:hypothetical protein
MEIQKDFKELLGLFNRDKVEYLIVGAYALAFYGAPRFTGDIDIYVRPEHSNAERIIAVLGEFGFGSVGLSVNDFLNPQKIIQLGYPPVRIDILTSISGVSWEEADEGKVRGNYGNLSVYFLGRDHYIANKKAIGRKKDLADLEAIGAE